MNGRATSLVPEEERLNGGLELPRQGGRIGRIADKRTIDEPATGSEGITVQVTLHTVIRSNRFIPLLGLPVEVGIRSVDSAEVDSISMMKTDDPIIDSDVFMDAMSHPPGELWESLG